MYDKQLHNFCSEFYTVEKSVEVVAKIRGEDTRIRIDVLKDNKNGSFSTKVYREEYLNVQQSYPEDENDGQEESQVWIAWTDFPWTDRDSAEGALQQALSFLEERCHK